MNARSVGIRAFACLDSWSREVEGMIHPAAQCTGAAECRNELPSYERAGRIVAHRKYGHSALSRDCIKVRLKFLLRIHVLWVCKTF